MLSILFKKFHTAVPRSRPVLGRWATQEGDKVVFRKMDLANEDHCGCCVPENIVFKKNDEFVICDDDVICVELDKQ